MEDVPDCYCGIPAAIRYISKEGPTKGQKFYGCSNWRPSGTPSTHCKFFRFAPSGDQTPSPQNRQRHAPTTAQRHAPTYARQPPPRATARNLTPRELFFGVDPIQITMKVVNNKYGCHIGAKFGYDLELNEFLKSLPFPLAPHWDPENRAWNFKPEKYIKATAIIQETAPKPVHINHVSKSELYTALRAKGIVPDGVDEDFENLIHGLPLNDDNDSSLNDNDDNDSSSIEVDNSVSEDDEVQDESSSPESASLLAAAAAAPSRQQKKQQQQQQEQQTATRVSSAPNTTTNPTIVKRTSSSECDRRIRTIQPLWSKLYEFQREAVQFGLQRGGRILLGDDMGLGKTVQALALAACYKEDWPLLIVAPSGMKLVWKAEIQKWLPPAFQPAEEDLIVVKDGKSATEKIQAMADSITSSSSKQKPRIVIVNYEMVKRLLSPLRALSPNVIIADESHNLKTINAQKTRAMKQLVATSNRAIFISGTPALSRPLELYPQLEMLRPGLFGTLDEYGMRYCDGKPALDPRFASHPSRYDLRGASNVAELKSRLERDILIRRIKANVLSQLPEKIRKRIPIEIPARSRGDVDAVKRELAALENKVNEGRVRQDVADSERQRLVNKLFSVTGPAKVPEAVQHIQALLDAGQKILIFAHHKEVLDALQRDLKFSNNSGGGGGEVIELLGEEEEDEEEAGPSGSKRRKKNNTPGSSTKSKKLNSKTSAAVETSAAAAASGRKRKNPVSRPSSGSVSCVRIDGSVTDLRRKAAVDAFQTDPAVRAALISITAGGVGITLTAATVVVFVELWWTPAALIQAEDRAHRVGQRGSLEVHYITAVDTADDIIWRSVQQKIGVVNSIVGDGGSGGGADANGASGSGTGRKAATVTPKNLFRDIEYAKRYENVQQRLAEEAEKRMTIAGGAATNAATTAAAATAAEEGPCLSNASTIVNPGANYAEVFTGQQHQPPPQEESSDDSEEEEESDEVDIEEEEADDDDDEEVSLVDSDEEVEEKTYDSADETYDSEIAEEEEVLEEALALEETNDVSAEEEREEEEEEEEEEMPRGNRRRRLQSTRPQIIESESESDQEEEENKRKRRSLRAGRSRKVRSRRDRNGCA